MRMNAETMKLNDVVLSTARELLALGLPADVENLVEDTRFSARQVKQAIASLISQKAVSGSEDEVTEVHGFHGEKGIREAACQVASRLGLE